LPPLTSTVPPMPTPQLLSDFHRAYQTAGLTEPLINQFRRIILLHYYRQGRDLPWRRTQDPYEILVSEVMLQQTQVERVVGKYPLFLQHFPDLEALAQASLGEILQVWQGLGYNRRAQALQRLAQRVVQEHHGRLPTTRAGLEGLPGIGRATAGALLAFAFGQPVVFLETNIRRVFIHFFYPESQRVTDRMLYPLVLMTMETREVRTWYYALMDYGAMLKKMVPNPNRRSAHYSRQSPFPGSDRELRSRILRLFLEQPEWARETLLAHLADDRTPRLLNNLVHEGFLHLDDNHYRLASGLERRS